MRSPSGPGENGEMTAIPRGGMPAGCPALASRSSAKSNHSCDGVMQASCS